jgi:glycosyltransferase involved in cell wall biosynthesis
MSLSFIGPEDNVPVNRGEAVVVVPVRGAHELFRACMRSIYEWTPSDVPILIADDASSDPRIRALALELGEQAVPKRSLYYLEQPSQRGFAGNCNVAFAVTWPGDVVLVNSDCVVSEGWFGGLRDAAYSDDAIATATALSNNASILSLPMDDGPGPPDHAQLRKLARAVRSISLRTRPRVPTAVGHCVYVRRPSIELVGGFDETFSPAYGEEVDFSQRCVLQGLTHVLADDVFVWHHGAGTLGANQGRAELWERHERLIAERYPYYHPLVEEVMQSPAGPLRSALVSARRATRQMSATIDARILSGPMTGSQLHVLELLGALDRTTEVRLRALVPSVLPDYAVSALARMSRVELLSSPDISRATPRTDIVHRPGQLNEISDLATLLALGDRLVVTFQDLLAYHNPAYRGSLDEWERYRLITRLSLAVADRVIFLSEYVAKATIVEGLVEPGRARIAHMGIDHQVVPESKARRPKDLSVLEDNSFLLCLGTDFHHKNRLFALRLFESLRRRHGWDGLLILAGPPVKDGSSVPEEKEYLSRHSELRDEVLFHGPVDEGEKAWLLEHARVVLYPTVHEGFGLIPFEAAQRGTPSAFAATTALSEVLPEGAACLVPWDADASADRVNALLEDPSRRLALVEAIRSASNRFRWDLTGRRMLEAYREAAEDPGLGRSLSQIVGRIDSVGRGVDSGIDRMLVGPTGVLPPDIRRSLLAVANRRVLRRVLFGSLRTGSRLRHALRRPRRRVRS